MAAVFASAVSDTRPERPQVGFDLVESAVRVFRSKGMGS